MCDCENCWVRDCDNCPPSQTEIPEEKENSNE
jgi:hypothetical protein